MTDENRFARGRHAGALVPLFSIPSTGSWGIGEIPDLSRFARWLEDAGLDFVQLLPVNEMADGQNSPYSALSAMAIDPIFIAVPEVPEFADLGGERGLSDEERQELAAVRRAPAVQFSRIRTLKNRALRAAFDRFHAADASERDRHAGFAAYLEREGWWIDDYALYRALHAEAHGRAWLEWDPPLRDRDAAALDAVRERLAHEIRYYAWLQWVADEQWSRARQACAPIGIFGDFPFMVSGDSADVWARQGEFRIDARVGVPPDAFSESGQDWGLPVYRWDELETNGYEWLRQRGRRCAELYDGFRIDHLVGFYRTFYREEDGSTHFEPPDEASQLAQGERLVQLFAGSGSQLVAEDLGTVPDFVRESLARLHVPGLKVLRWERDWEAPGKPFRDPSEYPPLSVAISGTHDTETLAEWWDNADLEERRAFLDLQTMRPLGFSAADAYGDALRDALLDTLFGARSDLLLVPLQDIFGWRDRINTPAVVDDVNWTWRLPWPVERLSTEAAERAAFIRTLVDRHGRAVSNGKWQMANGKW